MNCILEFCIVAVAQQCHMCSCWIINVHKSLGVNVELPTMAYIKMMHKSRIWFLKPGLQLRHNFESTCTTARGIEFA